MRREGQSEKQFVIHPVLERKAILMKAGRTMRQQDNPHNIFVEGKEFSSLTYVIVLIGEIVGWKEDTG